MTAPLPASSGELRQRLERLEAENAWLRAALDHAREERIATREMLLREARRC